MPIWEITDCNGNSHSVDLSKTSIKTIDDVKNEFKKFDQKRSKQGLKNLKNLVDLANRPSLRETQAMQARNRGGY